jgi:midasin
MLIQSQAVHPLVNEPRMSFATGALAYPSYFIVVACLREFALELYRLQQGLEQAGENAHRLLPSQMTRLERSLASQRIPSLMTDSTQPVGFFLKDSIQTLQEFIQSLDNSAFQSTDVASLRDMIKFCFDLFSATHSNKIDEGEFQTYLQIGRRVCTPPTRGKSAVTPLALSLSYSLNKFCSGSALTTGLSMQRIWDTWRPVTCVDRNQLKHLMELEEVASGFANVALQTRIDIFQLSQMWESLTDAQRSILVDGIDGDNAATVCYHNLCISILTLMPIRG